MRDAIGLPLWIVMVATAPARGETIFASWSDGHGLVRYPEDVRAEIESILHGAGVRLHWSDTDGESQSEAALGVVVVMSPSEPAGPGWHLPPSAMGVYLSTAESSAVYVFYHRVGFWVSPPGEMA